MTLVRADGPDVPGMPQLVAARRRPTAARIVVGVDGSPGSHAALRWASAEAARRQVLLQIVSAWEQPDIGRAEPLSPPVPSGVAATRLQDALDSLIRMDDRLRAVSCVAPMGEPGSVLVEQASEAGFLVLGANTGSRPGKTTIYCMQFASCPVVSVRA